MPRLMKLLLGLEHHYARCFSITEGKQCDLLRVIQAIDQSSHHAAEPAVAVIEQDRSHQGIGHASPHKSCSLWTLGYPPKTNQTNRNVAPARYGRRDAHRVRNLAATRLSSAALP